MFMPGPRYDLILASSGLALIIAIPLSSMAMDPTKLASTPMGVLAAEQTSMQPATAITSPANAVSNRSSTDPATATEQTAAPDPLASLDPADRAIAEKIRDLLATKLDRLFPSKKEAAAAVAFYQNRNLAPLWLNKGVENARAASAIGRMKSADSDGLEPSDYKPPNFAGLGPDALAEAELKLTQTVLTYARH